MAPLALRIVELLLPLMNEQDVGALLPSRHSNIDLVTSNAALGFLNMVSTADCPAALLCAGRLGRGRASRLELSLPAFARLEGEPGEVVGSTINSTGLLPTALNGGKTRECAQLAVGRLRWMLDAGKANSAHAAILADLEARGMLGAWGGQEGTILQPAVV
jgi:hypothetical protein